MEAGRKVCWVNVADAQRMRGIHEKIVVAIFAKKRGTQSDNQTTRAAMRA